MATGVSSIIARNSLIELGAASICVAGEALGILLLVERFQNHPAEPLCFIHKEKNNISRLPPA